MKNLIIGTVLFLASSSSFAAAFGFAMGGSLPLGAVEAEGGSMTYIVEAINPHPSFSKYYVNFIPGLGICAVAATSDIDIIEKTAKTNAEIVSILFSKYGKATLVNENKIQKLLWVKEESLLLKKYNISKISIITSIFTENHSIVTILIEFDNIKKCDIKRREILNGAL